jgi:Ni/Co efflux regulator RcnB
MYTYLVSSILSFIICVIIFGKSAKKNWFIIVITVFVGSLISTSVVTGVLKKDLDQEQYIVKNKKLHSVYTVNYRRSSDTIKLHYHGYHKNGGSFIINRGGGTFECDSVNFAVIHDSIPEKYFKIKNRYIPDDNNWISGAALPKFNKQHYVFLHQWELDTICKNNKLINYVKADELSWYNKAEEIKLVAVIE